ncbi:nitrilase-related carbon-nitrogen hydrolase [Ideonella paludis]|uniref:nitrilase-related carbon-nitrogen hydrolase n=1 Tax=Ideonella paludis TaxID=1233411 RepID=UPI003645BD09
MRPLICYEDLFGEDFAHSVLGPDAATLFANATNLAWFGRHMVQEQHQQFSRMRAIEFQRPFIRATNTGATGVINHRGEVTASLPAWTTGILEAQVEGRLGRPRMRAGWRVPACGRSGRWRCCACCRHGCGADAPLEPAPTALESPLPDRWGLHALSSSAPQEPWPHDAHLPANHSEAPSLLGCPGLRPAAAL